VHLVGFMIRTYNDARSSEYQFVENYTKLACLEITG